MDAVSQRCDGTGNMHQRLSSIGGTFERTSTPNNGTAVSLTLPLGKA